MPEHPPADRPSPDVERLPSGRHRLPRAFVTEHQRRRILGAVVAVAGVHGFGQLTVDAIIARAGVSRATFYMHFRNKDDVFLRACDDLAARTARRVAAARRDQPDALRRMTAGLGALLSHLAADPPAARTWMVESMAAGTEAAARRDAALGTLARLVAADLRELDPRHPDPDLTAETITGGVYQVLATRIRRGETAALPDLLPRLITAVFMKIPACCAR
ncbi:TetR/AcrR family transcriptional regulator [Actinomadura rubteroloni]|nr:TetR/AcrR family transcriptional regulator [Actinomadura rubteroloni]